MNKKQYVLNCDVFERQGPKFEMKNVAPLVHVHQLEASGVQPDKRVHHLLWTDRDVPVYVQMGAKDVRRSLPYVDLKYVLIRFKVL